jgi:hypothetical protein
MTAFIIPLTPIVLNLLMGLSKWPTGVQDTAGKRILLGLLVGVLAGSATQWYADNLASLSGFVQELLLAAAAFIAAHGSYSFLTGKTQAPTASLR